MKNRNFKKFLKIFWEVCCQKKKTFALIIFSLLLLSLARGGLVFLSGFAFESLVSGKTSKIPSNKIFNFLLPLLPSQSDLHIFVICVLVAGSFGAIAIYLFQRKSDELNLAVADDIRVRFFESLLNKDYYEVAKESPAAWTSRIINDTEFLRDRMGELSFSIVRDVIIVIASWTTLFFIHKQTALLLLVFFPIFAIGSGKTGQKISFYSEFFQKTLSQMMSKILLIRKRFEFIKSQQGAAFEEKKFDELNLQYYSTLKKSVLVRSAFAPILEACSFIFLAVFISDFGKDLWSGLSIAIIGQFCAALGGSIKPLKNIGMQINLWQESLGAMSKVFSFIDLTPISKERKIGPAVENFSFEGLQCQLQNKKVLDTPTFSLGKKEKIAIVGESGSGKSSFIKSLCGLFPANYRGLSCSPDNLYSSMSLLSQTPFLFQGTLQKNLTYGLHSIPPDEKIISLLKDVGFESADKHFLGREVLSFGQGFSGGELQRLAFVRTLLQDKPIILLDEPMASLDEANEERIINVLMKRNVAAIVVTHRTKFLKLFDRVLTMKNGALS